MTVTIHPTLPAEAELLATIQKAAFKPLYDRYRDEGNPYLRGPEDILCRLNRNYRQYTIECDGETVGGILYRLHGKRRPFDPLTEGEYYLGRIYVHPLYQNRGIAAEAIRLCEQEFPDATAYYVDFPADMDKNRRCYEKVGFADTGMETRTPGEPVIALYKKTVDPSNSKKCVRHPQVFALEASDLPAALSLIRESFATAAKKHGLTRENCPAHTSFVTSDYLERFFPLRRMYGLFAGKRMIGYMALSETSDCSCELHNLCIHPDYRGQGFGELLVAHAKAETVKLIGHPPTILCPMLTLGFIDEDKNLRNWYEKQGFVYTGNLKFDHLPFTSGYMEWKEIQT